MDLKNVEGCLPCSRDKKVFISKDTPDYFNLPISVLHEINDPFELNIKNIEFKSFQVKFFEEGVISVVLRLILKDYPIEELHQVRNTTITTAGKDYSIEELMLEYFYKIHKQIKPHIDDSVYIFDPFEFEKYTAFCIYDNIENIQEFLDLNNKYFAALLIGENPDLKLHISQVKKTLEKSFSFLNNEFYIFNLHRCLLIDPNKDYEETLLLIEQANYQLLELRTLDRFLDFQLDKAEDDIRKIFFRKRMFKGGLKRKLGYLLRLRYDMIFIWENLKNTAKIIGDFFLAQIYNHLSNLFSLEKWEVSIRSRLNILDDIYSTAKSDKFELILIILELLIVLLFIADIILLLGGFF